MRMTRALSRERTRDSLRKSAVQSFVRTGIAHASIEQIAQHAGFTRGAFYANYSSKLELVIDVLAARQVEEIGTWRAALQGTTNVEDFLEDLSTKFAAQRGRKSIGPLLAVELELEANRNPVFRPHYIEYLDQLFDSIRLFLETLLHICGRSFPRDLDRHVVTVRALSLTLNSQVICESQIGRLIDGRSAMRELLESIIVIAPVDGSTS